MPSAPSPPFPPPTAIYVLTLFEVRVASELERPNSNFRGIIFWSGNTVSGFVTLAGDDGVAEGYVALVCVDGTLQDFVTTQD